MLKSAGGGGLSTTDTPVVVSGAWTFSAGITVGNASDNPVSTFLGTGVVTFGGAIVVPRVSVNGSTVPANGIFSPSAGQLGISANSALRLNVQSTVISSSVVYSCSAAGSAASPSYALTSGNGVYLASAGVTGIAAASGGRLLVSATESTVAGNIVLANVGNGLAIKTGTNATAGSSVLVAGTVTVANTRVLTATMIHLTRSVTGGTVGHLSYTIINATSFTINSSLGSDTSTINWLFVDAAP